MICCSEDRASSSSFTKSTARGERLISSTVRVKGNIEHHRVSSEISMMLVDTGHRCYECKKVNAVRLQSGKDYSHVVITRSQINKGGNSRLNGGGYAQHSISQCKKARSFHLFVLLKTRTEKGDEYHDR